MYLEVSSNGNTFIFFSPDAVFYRQDSHKLVVITSGERFEFNGVSLRLWGKFFEEVGPDAKLFIDIDNQKVGRVGVD